MFDTIPVRSKEMLDGDGSFQDPLDEAAGFG